MGTIVKTYKFKLKPNSFTEGKFTSWINTCRAVYNLALETKIYAYRAHKFSLTKYGLIKQLPGLKKEFDWIKDVPSQSLQNVVERMDKAYQSFFKGGGFPRWAKKGKYRSVLFKQGVKLSPTHITLPKIGKVRYFNSQQLPKNPKIKTATVVKEVDGFYISLSVEEPTKPKHSNPQSDNQAVGIDVGVKLFYALSNGEVKENPKVLKSFEKELRKAQRSLSRKQKRSKNWYKQLQKVQKTHLKANRARMDFSHKCSSGLIANFGKIVVEDLKLKNMTKSPKGDNGNPGKNVKQKSGLNRAILDVGIGGFFRQLEYKSEWYGRDFVKVGPKHTSQTCNVCNHRSKENRRSQSNFECKNCGHKENADINAAKNILARAGPMSVNVVH